jgi:hypothetical protein
LLIFRLTTENEEIDKTGKKGKKCPSQITPEPAGLQGLFTH